MRRRDLLLMLASAAVGEIVLPTWLLAEAEEIEVTKTDEEWRRLLTPAQYQVLRHEATEATGSSPLLYAHRTSSSAPPANWHSSSRRPSSIAEPAGRVSGVRSKVR
jgi:hypothetical protein